MQRWRQVYERDARIGAVKGRTISVFEQRCGRVVELDAQFSWPNETEGQNEFRVSSSFVARDGLNSVCASYATKTLFFDMGYLLAHVF